MSNPSFPVVTVTVRTIVPSPEGLEQLFTKSSEMAAEGKTDNILDLNKSATGSIARRNWVDNAAANEWIELVQNLEGSSTSITIEN